MNYGYKVNDDGSVEVTPIEYYCAICTFTTRDQGLEQQHYQTKRHFTRSRIVTAETTLHNIEEHGSIPDWVNRKVEEIKKL